MDPAPRSGPRRQPIGPGRCSIAVVRKTTPSKPYNFSMVNEKGGRAVGSYLYSLLKVRTDFCKTLMEMSFPGNAHQQVGRLVLVE